MDLAPEQRATFDAHLGECPACVDYLASYRTTVQLGREVSTRDDILPEDVPPELIDAILATRSRS